MTAWRYWMLLAVIAAQYVAIYTQYQANRGLQRELIEAHKALDSFQDRISSIADFETAQLEAAERRRALCGQKGGE